MRIAIDISQIVYGTGVSVYTKELVTNLLKIDHNNQYLLVGSSLRRKGDLDLFVKNLRKNVRTDFEYRYLPIPPTVSDIIWNKFRRVSIDRFIGKVDVFHASDWSLPPTDAKVVTTVHDLVPILYPDLSHPKLVAVHGNLMDLAKTESDALIVPSKTTRRDLVKLGFDSKKINVIPEAVSDEFSPSVKYKIERVKKHYGITGKYVFALGHGHRKNTEKLIEAFKKTVLDVNVILIIAGGGRVQVNWRGEGVKFLGFVPQKHLPALFSGAEVFVYPSLYEGFGLPILESFACDTPVVTSDIGSMREIASGAAILVDPMNTISISKGIRCAHKDRLALIKSGRKRLKNYSWKSTATQTLKVYNSL
ncbi:glycosyltransferase family 4 protein [Patescibacteria group bacterium]